MKDKLHCFECQDGHYEKVRQTFVSQCKDGSFLTVPNIDILTCVKCGDECLDSENSKKIDKARQQHKQNNCAGSCSMKSTCAKYNECYMILC